MASPRRLNAVVPINEYFQLSVSFGLGIGTIDSYQAAIQAINKSKYPNNDYASLVEFEDCPNTNVWNDCDESRLLELIERAKTLTYKCVIEVFATRVGEKEDKWGFRFFCADGFDFNQKFKYCNWMFGKDNVRIIE